MPYFIAAQYILNYIRSSCGASSVSEFWQLQTEIKEYRHQVVSELKKLGIDALIVPAMLVPDMRIGECKDAIGMHTCLELLFLCNFLKNRN